MPVTQYRHMCPVARVELPARCGAVVTVLGVEYSQHDSLVEAAAAADAINRNVACMSEHMIRHHYGIKWPSAR